MNGIIGMTELTLDSDLNRSQRENLLLVHSLARSLLLIIDDILDISKSKYISNYDEASSDPSAVEAGRMTMEQVSYSIRQTVFGILKTLVVRASQNQLDLTYDVDPDIPDQLIGDSLRLRQVITNFVGNAIKFTSSKVVRKGHVALSCRLVGIKDSMVKLEFCLTDTVSVLQRYSKLDLWYVRARGWINHSSELFSNSHLFRPAVVLLT